MAVADAHWDAGGVASVTRMGTGCAPRRNRTFNLLIKRQQPPPARSDCRATHSEERQV